MNSEEMLRVEGLRQYFRDGKNWIKAVDDVSFSVKKGEILGIVGESGCGKTTTARSVIKLYKPTGGKVWFDGELISAGAWDERIALEKAKADKNGSERAKEYISEARENYRKAAALSKQLNKKYPSVTEIQMIFQDPMASLNPRMTIKEIIAEGLRIHGEKNEEVITAKVYDVLKKVGLQPDHANR